MKKVFESNQFKAEGELFLTSLLLELESFKISVQGMPTDHLCYRVETAEQYVDCKKFLSEEGLLLTEALVNGRAISTYRMKTPFRVGSRSIELLELPSPKIGAPYAIGFEHAEFVLNESFDQFAAKFPRLQLTRSGHKNINPELCLKTKAGQVKFHHLSLERVIEIEQAQIKDIIFDFDGTLIQSRENIYEINRIVFSEILGREVSLSESKYNFHPEFSKLFEAYGVDCQTLKERAISIWGDISERFSYQLFEGTHDFLKRLSSKSRIHLWTARDEKSTRSILKSLGIESLFTTMSFATDTESKPHGNSLKFDWKSADKNSTVVIGDSSTDIVGSKNIDSISAAALWDPHVHENALISSGAELYFYSLNELENWLDTKIDGR